MIKPYLFIKHTPDRGRGIFTQEQIPADEIVEISPVIVMPKKSRTHLNKTLLHDYIFNWGESEKCCAMALGYIPLYNHSYESNCEYFMNFEEEFMFVKTVRQIESDEELTVNYNGDWNDGKKVWFDAY